MAMIASTASSLKLVYSEEVDGKLRTRSKTFSNVDSQATHDGFLQAGTALGSLQTQAPDEVRRVDEMTLMA